MIHSARPVAHPLEHPGEPCRLVLSFGRIARLAQRDLHRAGGGRHAVLAVGEQVHVLSGPGSPSRPSSVTGTIAAAAWPWRVISVMLPRSASSSSSAKQEQRPQCVGRFPARVAGHRLERSVDVGRGDFPEVVVGAPPLLQDRARCCGVGVDRGLGPRPRARAAVEQHQQPPAGWPGESRCQLAGDALDQGPDCRRRVVVEQPEAPEHFRQPGPGHVPVRPVADLAHRHPGAGGEVAEYCGETVEHAAQRRPAPAPGLGELLGVPGRRSQGRVFRGQRLVPPWLRGRIAVPAAPGRCPRPAVVVAVPAVTAAGSGQRRLAVKAVHRGGSVLPDWPRGTPPGGAVRGCLAFCCRLRRCDGAGLRDEQLLDSAAEDGADDIQVLELDDVRVAGP